jgi:hypothetical protein
LFDTGFHYVAQAGLELVIFQPQPLDFWLKGMHHQAWIKIYMEKKQK